LEYEGIQYAKHFPDYIKEAPHGLNKVHWKSK